jgi:hypothetical protein
MKKLVAMLALVAMAQCVPADDRGRQSAPEISAHSHADHDDHDHHIEVIQVGQQQWFIAVCSRNDLNVRFNNPNDARRAADDHARATGHNTGVIRG